MTAFDTDVFSDILDRRPHTMSRLAAVTDTDRVAPVVTLEEVLRGRLNGIRLAQQGKLRLPADRAYDLLKDALEDSRDYRILPYTPAAHALFLAWRAAKIRVGTQDLRIAAVCLAHGATLVTRNARDYTQVHGLTLEVWN